MNLPSNIADPEKKLPFSLNFPLYGGLQFRKLKCKAAKLPARMFNRIQHLLWCGLQTHSELVTCIFECQKAVERDMK